MLLLVSLIVLGVTINILANAFLTAAKVGIERDFRGNYSGDVMIHGASPYPVTLFAVKKAMGTDAMEMLPELIDTDRIRAIVDDLDEVRSSTMLITNMGALSSEGIPLDFESSHSAAMVDIVADVFSGDAATYWDMFPAYTVTEGSFPNTEAPSMMISEETRDKFINYYDIPLALGDKILITGMGDTISIRELTVSGFYRINGSAAPVLSPVFIDNDTARSLAGLNRGSGWIKTFDLGFDLVAADASEDDLFGRDFEALESFESADGESSALSQGAVALDALTGILGGETVADLLSARDDSWNFMQLKLKNPADSQGVIEKLNAEFEAAGIGARAMGWEEAAVDFTSMTGSLVILFTVFMAIIGVVVLIVTMNLLLVSIMGRVPEIGTMRAIGAGRAFVRGLFFTETAILVSASALGGILLGQLLIPLINSLNIVFEGSMIRIMLGSGSVRLMPTLGAAAMSFLTILAGGIIANLYPVHVALSITPLNAMNRGA
jgi:putative ABC transport system permease protein